MFTSRSGAARRAARTVVAARRSAAPPWRRAGARTRGPRSGRRAAGRGSRDRPGTDPQAGTGAGFLTGTRTREVTSQVEVHRQAYAADLDGLPPHPAPGRGCPHPRRPVHSSGPGVPRAASGAHREGMDGRRAVQARRRHGRVGPRRTAAAGVVTGMAAGIALAAAAFIAQGAGARASPGAAGAPAVLVAAAMSTGRSTWPVPPGSTGTATGYVWPVDSSPGAAPVVEVPFREPTHRFGPGHRGVDLTAPVGAAVLAAAAGTVVFAGVLAGRGVVSVQHADGLRTTYEPVVPVVAARDDGPAGRCAGCARPRAPGLPGGMPALGGAPRARELPGPPAADDAAARPAATAARPVAGCLLSGPPPRGRRAAGRPAGRAADRPGTR